MYQEKNIKNFKNWFRVYIKISVYNFLKTQNFPLENKQFFQ